MWILRLLLSVLVLTTHISTATSVHVCVFHIRTRSLKKNLCTIVGTKIFHRKDAISCCSTNNAKTLRSRDVQIRISKHLIKISTPVSYTYCWVIFRNLYWVTSCRALSSRPLVANRLSGFVVMKKCFARPTYVFWSYRGSSMLMRGCSLLSWAISATVLTITKFDNSNNTAPKSHFYVLRYCTTWYIVF